jgi:sugar O-acyltransferase (sialic acid O-acetyltransferase NeuD family)
MHHETHHESHRESHHEKGDPLVVVGAGGFAAELVHYLRDAWAASAPPGWHLAGVVDDHLAGPPPADVCGAPFLGRLSDVARMPGVRFVVGSGTPRFRRETLAVLRAQGLQLHTLIHPAARVASDAVVGEGSIVAPLAIVNARARLGPGCVVNVFCSIGHDATVGDHTVLSPYAALGGGAQVGDDGFLGTRATVFPNIRVGARCRIDSHSCVRADTGDRMLVSERGTYRALPDRLES